MRLVRAFKKAGIRAVSMPLDLSRSMRSSLRSSMGLMHCTTKKVVLKAKAQKATSHQKRTVNSCYKGRMMADPLGIATVIFLTLKMGRSPMVVKEQFPFRLCSHQPDFFLPILDRPGISPNF